MHAKLCRRTLVGPPPPLVVCAKRNSRRSGRKWRRPLRPAICDFIHTQTLHARRMAGKRAATAAIEGRDQGPERAGQHSEDY
mgnify:CR=1 FL=1